MEADIFSLYDVDNNGEIEFKEFLLVISVMSEGTAKAKLQQIFRWEHDSAVTRFESSFRICFQNL